MAGEQLPSAKIQARAWNETDATITTLHHQTVSNASASFATSAVQSSVIYKASEVHRRADVGVANTTASTIHHTTDENKVATLTVPRHACNNFSSTVLRSLDRGDVLLGRGKRAASWPGNVQFRQIVNKYRAAYVVAPRNEKIYVAQRVVEEIMQRGGRFVEQHQQEQQRQDMTGTQQRQDTYYTTVSQKRATEKASQALRERVEIATRKPSPLPATHGPEQSKMCGRAETKETCASNDNDNIRGKRKERRDDSEQQIDQTLFPKSQMLQTLHMFRKQYGHAAVPPGWDGDVVFADWCTVQRQIYRELRAGYRKPCRHQDDDLCITESTGLTTEQDEIIQSLQKLEFVWEYENWHWEHQFDRYCRFVQNRSSDYSQGDDGLLQWLGDQLDKHNRGELSEERRQKLQRMGVEFSNTDHRGSSQPINVGLFL